MDTQSGMTPEAERKIRARLHGDFAYYAPRCLKIVTKPDEHGRQLILPFRFNAAQAYVHKRLEEQKARTGMVRALILKGRQQGVSTYTEGRFYHKTTNRRGEKTYILTHKQEATDNLFAMVERYHKNVPPWVQAHVTRSNQKELVFGTLDSRYQVATAGSKGSGRSATLTNVHGSEVAFWENAEDHLSGMLQAVPLAAGTEVILESTAKGVGNVFHKQWQLAESGQSDFQAIFVPWYWQREYTRSVPDGFEAYTDPEGVPEGELTEAEYQATFKLSDGQIYWRRRKIIELGGGEEGFWLFKQEYPATADEAFQATSVNSLLTRKSVLRARKSNVATEGHLILGVDPGGEEEGNDRSAIIRRRTRRLFLPQAFTTLNTMQLAATVHRIIMKEKPVRCFVDVGGKGKGVVDRLLEMPGTDGIVVPVNFGEAALDPEQFVNRKAEMAWAFKEWIEDPGGANIPDDDEIQADFLTSVADDPDSNQRKRLKSKKWLRSKGMRSPDLFDAACLTFAAPVGDVITAVGSSHVDFDPFSGDYGADGMGNSAVDFDPF
jgi:hypothetical protein